MKLIKGLYRIFDKYIILPITRIIVLLTNRFKKVNKPLESILKTKSSIIIISLVLAILIFIQVDGKNTLSIENNAEVLYNQKVVAKYNNQEYVIEGLPETVDITMIGSRANLYLAKQLANQDVIVDLGDLGVGTHQVSLKYKQAISNVRYKLDPSVVSVTISNKQSLTKDISKEYLNLDKMDTKFAINDVKLYNPADLEKGKEDPEDITTVIVKGKDENIKKVAIVKALINMGEISNSNIEAGDNTIKNIPLAAYDENGQRMNVELIPSTVTAVVNLESQSKEVPINVIVKNKENIIFGKAIESIDSSVERVTIYGSREVLNDINKIDVEISIPEDLKTNKKFTKTIKKPDGVRAISTKTITIEVKLGDQSTTKVNGVKISYKNLDTSKYVVQATAESTTEIPVILTGVESVISNISSTDIDAYVDLDGLTAGEQTVKVYATGSDSRVTYTPSITEIKLVIIEK